MKKICVGKCLRKYGRQCPAAEEKYFSASLPLDVTNAARHYLPMISSFKCRDTEALFNGRHVARFANIEAAAMRKLAMLNRAATVDDLRVPPGNRLEPLRGDRAGSWSIRVNDRWRLCFVFEEGHAHDVEIVDYH